MSKLFKLSLLVLFFLIWALECTAHHAMEYIEMESYSTTRQGEFVLHLHFDYMVEDSSISNLDHWEYTPGLSYGITNRLMFDVHTHFAKFGSGHLVESRRGEFSSEGPSPFMEAVAFALQYRLTQGLPVDIAVAAVYEEPFSRSKELLDGRRVFEGILIVSKSFRNHVNLCANLKLGKDGDETIKEWALGAKIPLSGSSHGIAAGVELLGDFDGSFAVLGGFYFPLGSDRIVFKTGLAIGNGSGRKRANSTLMYRF